MKKLAVYYAFYRLARRRGYGIIVSLTFVRAATKMLNEFVKNLDKKGES